jgi:hypothetical protein
MAALVVQESIVFNVSSGLETSKTAFLGWQSGNLVRDSVGFEGLNWRSHVEHRSTCVFEPPRRSLACVIPNSRYSPSCEMDIPHREILAADAKQRSECLAVVLVAFL